MLQILYVCCHGDRDEWVEAIQMVADKLAKQEEEGILCSPTTQIEIVNEEEMDTSISHHKRKVRGCRLLQTTRPACEGLMSESDHTTSFLLVSCSARQ